MKLRSLLLTALLGLGTLAPVSSAKADHCHERTRVTYDCHGCPIYWVYRVVGHEYDGCPRYAWVRSSPPVRYEYREPEHRHYSDSSDYGYRGRSSCDREHHAGLFFSFRR